MIQFLGQNDSIFSFSVRSRTAYLEVLTISKAINDIKYDYYKKFLFILNVYFGCDVFFFECLTSKCEGSHVLNN